MKTEASIARTACPKAMTTRLQAACACLWLLVLALPVAVEAQFAYTTNNGTITITGYSGAGGSVTIPDTINGLPVTSIGDSAFYALLEAVPELRGDRDLGATNEGITIIWLK